MNQVEIQPASRLGQSAGPLAAVGFPRLEAIDLLRGLVMVLMALDHVRDFLSNAHFNPTDLSRTTPALFLTRWVTHFCAPTFVFLAGTGAFLAQSRGRTRGQLAWFLLTRGLWLVILEFTLVHFGWAFSLDYGFVMAQVIWAIGGSMIVLAGLVFLPAGVIAGLGVLLIFGLPLLGGIDLQQLGDWRWLWFVLFRPGPLQLTPGIRIMVLYPLVPWLGILLAGYGFGKIWLLDGARRRRWLVTIGIAMIGLFIVLRTINRYGDPLPWSPQSDGLFTLLSFIDCQKYPPSPDFVLMTLGPAMLLLSWWDLYGAVGLGFLRTFGQVPLFYYLLHIPLIHFVAAGFAAIRYGDSQLLFQHAIFMRPPHVPEGYGYDLPVVYAVWIAVVVLLYPACRWFAGIKRRYRSAWLSYL